MKRQTNGQTNTLSPVTRPSPLGAPIGRDTPPTAPAARRAPTTDDVARRAYEIYLGRHGQEGSPDADWAQAERELRQA